MYMHDCAHPHYSFQTYVSYHRACPFGATSSVHSWERVGAAITVIARRLLRIPAFRYVDDLFGADRQAHSFLHALVDRIVVGGLSALITHWNVLQGSCEPSLALLRLQSTRWQLGGSW